MRAYDVDVVGWKYEPDYNTEAHRLFPWDGMAARSWGGAWVKVLPGETLTPHHHEENEIFFVVAGSGLLRHGDEERRVQFGSTLSMEPDVQHSLLNDGPDDLIFISVWWDGPVDLPLSDDAS